MYDILFLGKDDAEWQQFKLHYPNAYRMPADSSWADLKKQSFTKMFWVVWDKIVFAYDFNLNEYRADEWDDMYVHIFKNGNTYNNGVCLFPKSLSPSTKEFNHRFFTKRKEVDKSISYPVYDILFLGQDDAEWQQFKMHYPNAHRMPPNSTWTNLENKATTKMFWVVWDELVFNHDFDLKKYNADVWDNMYVHIFKNGNTYNNGVCLFPKSLSPSTKEFNHRFFTKRKEVDSIVTYPSYDILFLGQDDAEWQRFKLHYPNAHRMPANSTWTNLENKATTKMFWVIWNELAFDHDFDLKKYNADVWDNMYVHVFKNGNIYDGVCLFSKKLKITQKEIDYRYFVKRKEVDISVSVPEQYEKIYINNYEDYINKIKKVTSDFVWVIPDDITVDYKFDYQIPYWEKDIVHVFKNGNIYDGIFLQHKNKNISQKEIDYRYIVKRKEVDISVSVPEQYEKIYINNYEDYINKIKKVTSDFVWVIPNDVELDFDFDYQIPYWEKDIVHVFKNGNIYDGIFLQHKNKNISQKEIDYRYIVKRKEVDIQASKPLPYEKIYISDYNDYKTKIINVNSDFVWVIPNDVELDFDFDYQIPYWEQDIVHIFRNGKYFDGIFLQHKNKNISQKEIDYRFFIKKKEIDITASNPIKKELDIVFISYNEPNADKNFELLQLKFPRAQRVHGITGIHNAHIEAAKLCTTDMFYVVDADAIIVDNFNFDYQVERWNKDAVHVFRSKNPINDLIYGYGGIKLLPRIKTLNLDTDTTDMTTSISSKFKAVDIVSNITAFNTDPFNTWKSAFRECVKLSSKVIARQKNNETDERLLTWCVVGEDRPYGKFAVLGAKMGKDYGESHRNDKDALKLINNFKWLEQKFKNEVQ